MRSPVSSSPGSQLRPLLVVDEAELLDDMLRMAADAGVEVDVAPDPVAARPRYAAAPLVVVVAGLAGACARAHLPRRPGVVLVSADSAADPPWDLAESIGAEHVAVLPRAMPWLVE